MMGRDCCWRGLDIENRGRSMLHDIRTLPDGHTLSVGICIIGAGPVGISLARELIGKKVSVCLLESGDTHLDEATQSLADGEVEGARYPTLDCMRRRQFGGLSNAWNVRIEDYARLGVRHLPLDEVDFEQRDWLPHSGWPFGRAHLDPYYERASKICGIGPLDYQSESWERYLSRPIQFPDAELETTMFQFGPSGIFANEYRKDLEAAENVDVYLNANVVKLEATDNAGTVKAVKVAALSGQTYMINARVVVLAAGGIENARLLLQSNDVATAGLGNLNDVVGRYFMDHPLIRTGLLFPNDPSAFKTTALYDMRYVEGLTVMGKMTFTQEARRQKELLGISAMLMPRTSHQHSPAHLALRELRQSVRERRPLRRPPLKLLGEVVTHADDLVQDFYKHRVRKDPLYPSLSRGGWSKVNDNQNTFDKFEVLSQTEQSPDPNNRVVLSERRDRLGSNRPKVQVRWTDFDKANLNRAQTMLVREFAASGFGRLELENMDNSVAMSTHHNMGTTRMHADPRKGVVDANGKVHGLSNLFATGGSVFPTGGYANPTLTMIALAVRLADHLTHFPGLL